MESLPKEHVTRKEERVMKRIVSVLLVLILLPYVFLISTGGRLLSLLGYIGLIATLAECALIIIPLSQPRNHEDN